MTAGALTRRTDSEPTSSVVVPTFTIRQKTVTNLPCALAGMGQPDLAQRHRLHRADAVPAQIGPPFQLSVLEVLHVMRLAAERVVFAEFAGNGLAQDERALVGEPVAQELSAEPVPGAGKVAGGGGSGRVGVLGHGRL